MMKIPNEEGYDYAILNCVRISNAPLKLFKKHTQALKCKTKQSEVILPFNSKMIEVTFTKKDETEIPENSIFYITSNQNENIITPNGISDLNIKTNYLLIYNPTPIVQHIDKNHTIAKVCVV